MMHTNDNTTPVTLPHGMPTAAQVRHAITQFARPVTEDIEDFGFDTYSQVPGVVIGMVTNESGRVRAVAYRSTGNDSPLEYREWVGIAASSRLPRQMAQRWSPAS